MDNVYNPENDEIKSLDVFFFCINEKCVMEPCRILDTCYDGKIYQKKTL